jgi:hypothetical protein
MKRLYGLLLLICPLLAYGWGFNGHMIVAQIAYDNLTPMAKIDVDALSGVMWNHLTTKEQAQLSKDPKISTFVKLAELGDIWRLEHLGTIFVTHKAVIPANMLQYADIPTRSMHFIDMVYPRTSTCKPNETYTSIWAIDKLTTALQTDPNPSSRAIEMTLLEHWIGDLHQPLHNISKVDSNCVDDRGGNSFCVHYNLLHVCTLNLHHVWDLGVMWIKPTSEILVTSKLLEQQYPQSTFGIKLQDTNTQDWALEMYSYADFIYSAVPGKPLTTTYLQTGQNIAKYQLALAGYRLAQTLNKELDK